MGLGISIGVLADLIEHDDEGAPGCAMTSRASISCSPHTGCRATSSPSNPVRRRRGRRRRECRRRSGDQPGFKQRHAGTTPRGAGTRFDAPADGRAERVLVDSLTLLDVDLIIDPKR
jgi:hypothetical protein